MTESGNCTGFENHVPEMEWKFKSSLLRFIVIRKSKLNLFSYV